MTVEPFPRNGGCHCRALRYAIARPPLGVYACHCTDCQTLSGAAFGIAVVVPSAAFTLTGSPRLVPRVLGSGRTSNRWICPECGVWICGDPVRDATTAEERRFVRGGTFDDTSWLSPSTHYWTRSAQPWIVFPEGAVLHETQP
jgi:hypothetical protein